MHSELGTKPGLRVFEIRHILIYIYTNTSGSGERLRTGISGFGLSELSALRTAQNRPELLKIAQSAPRAAQSRSESVSYTHLTLPTICSV